MRPQDLIRIKRDGREMPSEMINEFITGVSDGTIPDYQISALLMAIFWRGMSETELSTWTEAMLHSGKVINLKNLDGPKVDKHSTGGVGDKVTLCLAPLVAACGVYVPSIAGRGLGHTGGTLDKLESIPGFRVASNAEEFERVLRAAGCAVIGQTNDLAPADRKLYALRDVTSTVESIPLIASSIMSKKLAEGTDALVLDVKVGTGAFMKTQERARLLAQTLCGIGRRAGKKVTAFLTDMNQVLGREVGSSSEMIEAIDILKGQGPDDLWQITAALGAEMLVLGGVAKNTAEAQKQLDTARQNGAGLERLRRSIEAQGGDPRVIDDYQVFPGAKIHRTLVAKHKGFLSAMDTEKVGLAAMILGAGRKTAADKIDHGVGLTMMVRLGDEIRPGDPLAILHYNDESKADEAEHMFRAGLSLDEKTISLPPLIHETLR